ncbi:unnamed protein product [Rotaria sp. Silwood2]|nr:unnamed protein product [Rotaria sp. Silwood2]
MTYVDLEHLHGTLTTDTTHVLTIAQIYHLKITEENVYVGALIEAVSLLPEFTTLKIHSLSLHKSILLNSEEVITHFSMNEIEEISFFLNVCPYLEYLKMDYIKQMDLKFVLQYILEKIKHDCNEYLHLLCFRVPTADNETIEKLKRMINFEKLLWNYTIKHVADNLYLEWQ